LLDSALGFAGADDRLIITEAGADISQLSAYDWLSISAALLSDVVDAETDTVSANLERISAEDWVTEVMMANRVISWG
ncbi:MAG: hypothetical protein L7S45_07320, partial [Luminiphilus sp.]|nr:hypothetical protein [Luminiphilus sp.]